ncbi:MULTISPECIES: adenylate/guanylate cyclase domain-containing protein [Rhizobium]|uniref:Adenylate cyclase protein n=1 Tax=Rhizobium favelukesii TaxID=348824 RepID=W6R5R9_9HYPH|nr:MULTISPECIES: adenylate/guanylate cyclase domain-containing protein [Rhizobium]MCS0463379.1 adenylate/guanylate cyclase domain-containing protein [Rhizobium favelukesii]UFS82528.1 adenylate/guanylate cyclase domain-containing protein [Rhizobium sp. T136]CDM55750.1 adenylate cyclase protein [Rhizobium favelukesii]
MRKLAAVLCIDVASYSKLMGRDEAGTLARVKAAFAAFDPVLERHHGRIVKLMGDGALIEFASAVDATAGAIALQSVASATDPTLRFRMGLNLGDVIVEDGDLYGEGVNIAARLQALAQPGGIILSETVREHVGGKLNVALEDLGPMSLKNIERPIRVFAIQGDSPAEARSSRERIGICVLPFANISGDPEQDYFSAGVTEDIIIDLSKLSSLTVISRATSFSMKAQSARAIAQQLNVAYVLEGKVRKAGERIRLSAQLVDGTNDATVWAERFDRDIKDVLALQSDLAKAVVEALRLRLLPAERQALERYAPTDPEAYKLFLLARQYNITGSERHLPLIIRLCRRVTDLEPGNARAWALLGETLNRLRRSIGGTETGEAEIDRALELDAGLASAHAGKALLFLYRGQFEEAERQCAIALQLEPDDYAANLAAGRTFVMQRRFSAIGDDVAGPHLCQIELTLPSSMRSAGRSSSGQRVTPASCGNLPRPPGSGTYACGNRSETLGRGRHGSCGFLISCQSKRSASKETDQFQPSRCCLSRPITSATRLACVAKFKNILMQGRLMTKIAVC